MALAACTGPLLPEDARIGDYLGIETRLLEGDLVNFLVRMSPEAGREQVESYAECAAARYALIRGYGFARHVRTNVEMEGGVWLGDAVYTISNALPEGLRTIDAEVVVALCEDTGIPTV
ncbi:hypothetical protein KTJ87_03545 [Rhodobacteraceae bacterium ASV31]|nr:hypothetical protein [Anianabacter salinae]MBV0911440.1 hypothetical protein [Anianabacter salinae]